MNKKLITYSWRLVISGILMICGANLLVGCGQNARSGISMGAQNMSGQTGGVNNAGQPYLTVSPTQEVNQMKTAVNLTDANKDFSSPFGAVNIVPQKDDSVYISVDTDNKEQPLIFKGKLNQTDSGYTGDFSESSGSNLDLQVSCPDVTCKHADLILKDDAGHQAAIIKDKQDGFLHQPLAKGETDEQLQKEGLEPFGQDTPVEYDSTEILPGKTIVTVRTKDKTPVTLFQAQVHDSGDDYSVPAEIQTPKNSGLKATLVGADSGQAVFGVTNQKQQQTYYEFQNPQTTEHDTVTLGNCPVRVSTNAHPLVTKILKEDCADPRITPYITTWTKTKSKNTILNYLNLFSQSQNAKAPGQAMDFKLMLDVLNKNNLPSIWSFIPIVESSFDWRRTGKDGEKGVWQFMLSTAKNLGLTPEQRKEIVPATQAASDYFNDFLSHWDNNVKMSLASYNAGLDGVSKSLFQDGQKVYTNDFWKMCRLTLNTKIKNGTCKYVPKIVAAMIVSLDPEAYGVPNVGAMEAK